MKQDKALFHVHSMYFAYTVYFLHGGLAHQIE